MSQPGPVILVSDEASSALSASLARSRLFPIVESRWADAAAAIARVAPSGIIVSGPYEQSALEALSDQVSQLRPYVAMIVGDPTGPLPANALPFTMTKDCAPRFNARLNTALRVRTLHATVLRRLQTDAATIQPPTADPLADATILLAGRGGSFPALSVAFGERVGVIGALSIEAAAKHLNTRNVDGVIVSEGFSPRVADAFLLVLSEDSRFRNLPVVVTTGSVQPERHDLPNMECISGSAADIVAHTLPLVRQSAFETVLQRTLQSLDANGRLDPRTGLLTQAAFVQEFANSIAESHAQGAGLSVARFTVAAEQDRSRFDAARIMSRLMRRMDFATLRDDGSIAVVFAGTGLQDARLIAKRLASVLKQTVVSSRANGRLATDYTVAALLPGDTAATVLKRLEQPQQRAAS